MRWKFAAWVDDVNVRWRPLPKSISALAVRSGLEGRVAIDERDDAYGLGAEDVAADDDRVAADVVERAAADVGHVAHVVRVDVVVREQALDGAELAKLAGTRQLARLDPTADGRGP